MPMLIWVFAGRKAVDITYIFTLFLPCSYYYICRVGSYISGKGVHIHLTRGVRFADFLSFFQNIPFAYDQIISFSEDICLFVLLLYVPIQQLWSLRDGQFT